MRKPQENQAELDAKALRQARLKAYHRTLRRLHRNTIKNLTRALHTASSRLARGASGEDVFSSPMDLNNCLFIARMLPMLKDEIPTDRSEPDLSWPFNFDPEEIA